MKKKILMILVLLLSIISLVGCDKGKNDKDPVNPDPNVPGEQVDPDKPNPDKPDPVEPIIPEEETLQAPTNVTYENKVISWDKVDKATSYDVIINDSITEVTTNQYKVNEIQDYIDVVTIISKSDKAHIKPSVASSPILLKKELSKEEIAAKITGYDETGLSIEEKALANQTALLLYKYDLTEQVFETDENVIREYVENNKIGALASFYLCFIDGLVRQMQLPSVLIPELTDLEKQEYQKIFDELKQKQIYESDKTNALEDERFINFYLPIICGELTNGIASDYDLMISLAIKPGYSFEIIKVDEGFRVKDNTTGLIYILSSSKINKLINDTDINITNDGGKYQDIIETSKNRYIMNITNNFNDSLEKQLALNEVNLAYSLNKNQELLNSLLIKIYNSAEQITLLEEQISNALTSLENANTPEEKIRSIDELRKAIEQIFKFQEQLPKTEELSVIIDIILDSNALDYLLTMTSGVDNFYLISSDSKQKIKALALDILNVYDEMTKIMKDTVKLNLDVIFNYLLNPENKLNQDRLNNLVSSIYEKITKIDFKEYIDITNLMEVVSMVLRTQNMDIKSIIGIISGIEFNDNFNQETKALIKELYDYISKYDFTKLEQIISSKDLINIEENIEFTNEEKMEFVNLINYLSDYVSIIDLDKYEFYIKNTLQFILATNPDMMVDNVNADVLYNLIKTYRQEYVDYILIEPLTNLFPLYEGDMSNEELMTNLTIYYQIVKEKINNGNKDKLLQLIKTINGFGGITEETDIEKFLTGDLDKKYEKINQLIGKLESQLTVEEKAFIDELPFVWVYPNGAEFKFDEEKNELVLQLYDKDLYNKKYKLLPKNGDINNIAIEVEYQIYDITTIAQANEGEIIRISGRDIINIVKNQTQCNTYEEYIAKYPYGDVSTYAFELRFKVDENEYSYYVYRFDISNYLEILYNIK